MPHSPKFPVKTTYEVIENLVSNYADHLEGLLGGDRVYQHVAMNADEVLRVQYAVLILQEFIIDVIRRIKTCAKQSEHFVTRPICLPDQLYQ